MQIDLSGQWLISLKNENCFDENQKILLPGILQSQGYGNEITIDTLWVSGLHDSFWYKREEYKHGQKNGCNVPFLSQPARHYIGKAWYKRQIIVPQNGEYVLFIELCRWRTTIWLDGGEKGGDCTLCTPHEINLGYVEKGAHQLTVCVDNSMQYPYRPDGHGVSDALGVTWNGMAGEISLRSAEVCGKTQKQRAEFAKANKRSVQVINGKFYVDGCPEYFRGTHFGGEYPLTGYPDTSVEFWQKIFNAMQDYGINFMRCHSCCLPETAFKLADKMGIYIQVECGMWNVFNEGVEMLEVLLNEASRIIKYFGHHPSFVMLSSTNEPDGQWYKPLTKWVSQIKQINKSYGYEGRRIFTAQSGWFYDVPPKDVTGTDYIYFHRSGYGPILGGNIRNHEGWNGKDYRSSLQDCRLPVICHELGQWCAYPDFNIIEKFTGYLQAGNYKVFKENAKAAKVLCQNAEFVKNSGMTQLMMYKEELEANLRTPSMYGFELLDLHDYLGQGTAVVGVLDAFWNNKGYASPKKWRQSCSALTVLARIPSYTYKNTDKVSIPLEICNFTKRDINNEKLKWSLIGENVNVTGEINAPNCLMGDNTQIGEISLDFSFTEKNSALVLTAEFCGSINTWDITVFVPCVENPKVHYTKNWLKAKKLLQKGEKVVFSPCLSSLDYNCPGLNIKPVFWNAQMGPSWVRPMGMIADVENKIFKSFPTFVHGGWQWEDILNHARGFCTDNFPADFKAIVQPIDEWNRNIKMALIFEAKVLEGSLLFVSADLEGDFNNRPAASALKTSLLEYAASIAFKPAQSLDASVIEAHFHNCNINKALNMQCPQALLDENPNVSFSLQKSEYPFKIELKWNNKININGLIFMQNQKDRMHEGDVNAYEIFADGNLIAKGNLKSTIKQQKIIFNNAITVNNIAFVAKSGFTPEEKPQWVSDNEGWHLKKVKTKPSCCISVLQPITNYEVLGNDRIFWDKNIKSSTKEIDD